MSLRSKLLVSIIALQCTTHAIASDFVSVCDRSSFVNQALTRATGAANCGEVTEEMLGRLEKLEVSSSFLMRGDFSGLKNLKKLTVGNDQLASIGRDTFYGLENLQNLKLRVGQAEGVPAAIHADAFISLSSLKSLYVFGLIEELRLEPGSFRGLKSLESLDTQFIEIDPSIPGLFAELESLRTLTVRISSEIPTGVFSPMKDLRELSLGTFRDHILTFQQVLDSGLKLENLTHLSLYSAELKLPAGSFAQFNNLKHLEAVNRTDNLGLESHSFIGLSQLESLRLESQAWSYSPGQQTEKLGRSIFYGLRNLKKLSLKNRYISRIGFDDFQELVSLESMDLELHSIKSIEHDSFRLPNLGKIVIRQLNKDLSASLVLEYPKIEFTF